MTQTSTTIRRDNAVRIPLDIPIVAIANRFGGTKAVEVERFLRFAVVGLIGAVIDSGSLYILQATIIPPSLQTPDWNVALAETITFILAITNNFLWNRYWTYPDSRSRPWPRQMAQFAFISLVGWIGRTIWITASHAYIGHLMMPVALPFIQVIKHGYVPTLNGEAKLGTLASWVIGVLVVMLWNFFANRFWTYNDVD